MATSIDEIDVIVKKKGQHGSTKIQILADGSIHVQGGGADASELRHLRQIGELVSAAVNGTLQSAHMTPGVGDAKPTINIMKMGAAHSIHTSSGQTK